MYYIWFSICYVDEDVMFTLTWRMYATPIIVIVLVSWLAMVYNNIT